MRPKTSPNKSRQPRGGKRPGAGRPKGPTRLRVSVLVLPETWRTIDLLAFASGVPRGEILDRWARRFVRKKTPPAP